MKRIRLALMLCVAPMLLGAAPENETETPLTLGQGGYLTRPGLDVIVFDDIYPDGHQTGVTVIQHGVRVAANGDVRLEPEPGQWSPIAKAGERTVDRATGTITQALAFPDPDKNGKGFNPIFYPDLELGYRVRVTPLEGNRFRISVDLDKPLPAEWVGKAGFNLELFPTHLFGKSWILDGASGIFPRQPGGPVERLGGGTVPDEASSSQARSPATSPSAAPAAGPRRRAPRP